MSSNVWLQKNLPNKIPPLLTSVELQMLEFNYKCFVFFKNVVALSVPFFSFSVYLLLTCF